MTRARFSSLAAALLLAAGTVAPAARAQPGPESPNREAARALAERGFELFSEGRYESALALFRDAEQKYHAPPHQLFMARALARLGRLLEAAAAYERVVDEKLPPSAPEPYRQAQEAARKERVTLEERIPTIRLVVKGAQPSSVAVSIDGAAIPVADLGNLRRIDPGTHAFVADASGFERIDRTITVSEGAHGQPVELVLHRRPAPPPPESGDPNWRLIGGIGAIGGSVVFAGLGVMSAFKVTSIQNDDKYDAYRRQPEHQSSKDICATARAGATADDVAVADLCDTASTFEVLQVVFAVSGALSLGTGIYLVATSGKPHRTSATGLTFAPRAGRGRGGLDVNYRF